MTIQIEVGAKLMDFDSEETTVVSVKGRWVKLEDGRNISREQAAEWIEFYRDSLDPESETPDLDDEGSVGSMSGTLLKYRKGYQKAVSYTQGPTLDNGDALATALRGLSPADVCAIADAVYNEIPGSHFARYEHLNIGSRRMNAGNRIRGAIRKELITLAEVLALTGHKADAAE